MNYRNPQYSKGEIYVFGIGDLSVSFVQEISNKLGYLEKVTCGVGDAFIIKTVVGREKQAGSYFTENYPEFFSGYERIDLRHENFLNKCESIKNDLDELEEEYNGRTGNLRFIDKEEFNEKVDSIIEQLKGMKIK